MKPLLAATVKDVEAVNYPVYASAKLDGIRCLIHDGEVLSRSLKSIPNKYIQHILSNIPAIEGFDGELIVGDPTDPKCFNITQSAVMSKEGCPDFTYYVFDLHDRPDLPFHQRYFALCADVLHLQHHAIQAVPHVDIASPEGLLAAEEAYLAQGYEGVMVRDANAMYKYGRSTLNQGILLKLKRFIDSEAKVIGYEELIHADGEVGNTLGSLIVVDINSGVQFKIGTGFSQADRDTIWADKDDRLLGKLVKYKSFPIGVKDKPRFPTFIGFRDKRDLS